MSDTSDAAPKKSAQSPANGPKGSKPYISSHAGRSRSRVSSRGFAIAPILYMLGLIGIGAGILFSGYSQILRSNKQVTDDMTAKSDAQAAGTTLAASSVLSADTTTLCPPQGGGASAGCANAPVKMTPLATVTASPNAAQLPANASAVSSTGTPSEVGVFAPGSGMKQLDPFGHYYIYCRWENARSNPGAVAFTIISAGPDGTLQTKCGDTVAQGDDTITQVSVGSAIERSAVWETSTDANGNATDVHFGQVGSQLKVDALGDITVPGSLGVAGTSNLGTVTAGSVNAGSGGFSALAVSGPSNLNGGMTASSGTISGSLAVAGSSSLGALSATNAAVSGSLGVSGATTLGTLTAGTATLQSANISNNATVGGTLGVTGDTTVGGTFTANTATLTTANVSSNATVGGTLAVTGAATLGNVTAGTATLNSASISNNATVGGSLAVTGALTGSGATFSGTVTANAFVGAINGNVSGTATNVTGVVAIANGGTGATTALAGLTNLGGNNASNLNTGTLSSSVIAANSIPGSDLVNNSVTGSQLQIVDGGSAGTYNWGTVDAYGRVTNPQQVTSSGLTDGAGDSITATNSSGTGQLNFYTNGTQQAIINSQGYLGLGTLTPMQRLDMVGNERIEGAAGTPRQIQFTTGATSERWVIETDGTAEGGSNAGSNFVIQNYTDTGTAIATPALTIQRSTGNATFSGVISGNGSGLTSIPASSITGAVNASLDLGSSATAANPQITGDPSSGFFTPGAATVAVTTGGVERMRWDSTGKVGIGTTSPAATLQVAAGTSSGTNGYGLEVSTPTGATNNYAAAFTGGNVGIGTTNPGGLLTVGNNAFEVDTTGAVTIGSTAVNAISYYNTADQVTNYQRLVLQNPANEANGMFGFRAQSGGNAAAPAMEFAANGGEIRLSGGPGGIANTENSGVDMGVYDYGTPGWNGLLLRIGGVGWSASSGIQNMLNINNLVSQTGTAGYNALLINSTESSTGSGSKYLINAQVGGNGEFTVSDTGSGYFAGAVGIGTASPTTGTALDLGSNNTSANSSLLLPSGASAARPTTGVNGMIRYNSGLNAAEGFINGAWSSFLTAATGGGATAYLGTSAATTNPSRQGELTTGLYTAGTGLVDVAVNIGTTGTQVGEFSSTGLNLSGASEALNINGINAIRLPASDSTAGGSIAIGPSALAGQTATAAYGNTALGYQALHGTMTVAATQNTALGFQALSATTSGTSNTAVGYSALPANTTGGYNLALGYNALASSTAGNGDIAIGPFAQSNMPGTANYYTANLAIGYGALEGNGVAAASNTGSQNLAIGYNALGGTYGTALTGTENTGVGSGTVGRVTSGSSNTAVGYNSLQNVTSGSGNTTFGQTALVNVTTGSGNTAFGSSVGSTVITTGSNNILIGTDNSTTTPLAGTSNWLNIGNSIYGYNLYNGSNTTGVAQIAIGTNLTSVTAGAVLDLSQNTTSANSSMILPVGSSAARPTTGINGMVRYNSSNNTAEGFINGVWAPIATGTGSGIYLGTSATTANPQVQGDLTTGFYTPAASTVAVTANGVEAMQWNTVASGVDYVTVTPAVASGSPIIGVAGSANAGLNLTPAGTGGVAITSGATTGAGLTVIDNAVTTGNVESLSSTSTAGTASGTDAVLNLSRSGANANTAHTAYGVYSTVTNTNATSGTNVAGYFSASGATTANYGLIVANGNVGIGTTSPTAGAALDLSNNTTSVNSSLLLPVASTAARPSTGVNGMIRYNNTLNAAEGFINGAWISLLTGSGSGGGATTYLGTAASATNPSRSGEVTTGFYTAGSGLVDVAVNVSGTGTQVGEWSSSGLNLTGAAEALKINGVNGVSFPTSDSLGGSIAIGSSALSGQTASAAYGNTAIGYQAMGKNPVTGVENVAIGYQAMYAEGDANSKIAIGYFALYNGYDDANSTGVGSDAFYSNIHGQNNSCLGTTCFYLATGGNNTGLGAVAGHSVTSGTNNLVLGYSVASTTLTTGSNNILVGTDASTTTPLAGTSNWLNIGNAIYGYNLYNSTNSTGVAQVAIGTNLTSVTAGAVLDLSQNTTSANSSMVLPVGSSAARPTTGINGMVRYNSTNNTAEGFINGVWAPIATGTGSGIYLGTSVTTNNPQIQGDATSGLNTLAASTVGIATAGVERLTINGSGYVGIGTGSPAASLQINSLTSSGTNGYGLEVAAPSGATNNYAAVFTGGNVGIGTTSPAIRLALSSNGSTTSSPATIGFQDEVAGNANRLAMNYSSTAGGSGDGLQVGAGQREQLYGYYGLELRGNRHSAYDPSFVPGNTSTDTSVTVFGGYGDSNPALQVVNYAGTSTWLTVAGGGNVGIGTTTPATGAALDLSNNTTSANSSLLLPVASTAARPTTGVNGMIRYNNTLNAAEGFINGAWIALLTSSGSGGGATTYLGTAASATNPSRSGEVTTGLYTAGSGLVDIAVNVSGTGTQVGEFSSGGLNLTGAAEALQINGVNGISFPTSDSGNASIAIGSSALSGQTASAAYSNTAIGYQAMSGTMTTAATGNAAVGYAALKGVTSGNDNTALGFNAAQGVTTGAGNTAVGWSALFGNSSNSTAVGLEALNATTGARNTALGFYSGLNIGSGTDNLALGYYALRSFNASAITGSYNTAVGDSALKAAITTAANNTALGYQAGTTVTTGSSNTILGTNVASTTLTTGSNNILLGTDASTTTPLAATSNWLNIGNAIYGYNLYNSTNSGGVAQIAIGTNLNSVTAGAVLDLSQNTTSANSSLLLPVGTTTARPTTGVNGMFRYNSTLNAAEGFFNGAWTSLLTAGSGVSAGVYLGTSVTTNNPQIQGDPTTGLYTPAASNVAVTTAGTERLRVDGSGNLDIGTTSAQAGYIVTANGGVYSSSTGASAFYGTTSSATNYSVYGANTAISGNGAHGVYGTTASAGTASGVYGSNTAAGNTGAGVFGTNPGTGAAAGVKGTETGASNTGYGGYFSNSSTTGWSVYAAGTSPSYFAGNVGIGTTAPTYGLDVSVAGTSGYSPASARISGSGTEVGLSINNTGTSGRNYSIFSTNSSSGLGGGNLIFGDATLGAARMTINSSGNVGIGTTVANNTVEVGSGLLGTLAGTKVAVSNGSANSGFDLGQASANRGRVFWNYNATAANAYMGVGVASGTNPLVLQDAGGSVGIGTTSPAAGAVLDLSNNTTSANSSLLLPVASTAARPSTGVNGMIRYNNTLNAAEGFINGAWSSFLTASSGISSGVYLGTAASATNPQRNGDPATGLFSPATGTVAIATGSGETMRVTSTGVGIGITAPTASLQVFTMPSSGSTGYGLEVNAPTGATSNYAAVFSNGNVGIGTTAPTASLQVASMTSAGTNGYGLYVSAPTGATNNYGAVFASGNVGIGTTSPSYPLDVENNSSTVDTVKIRNTNVAGYPDIDFYDASNTYQAYVGWGNASAATDANVAYFGTVGATSSLQLQTNYIPRLTIASSGYVGIGTVNPATGVALDLSANTTVSNSSMLLPVGSSAARPTTGINGMIRYNSTNNAAEGFVNGAWSSFLTASSGISSGVYLGTAASATNPSRSGEVTTGFYTAGTGLIDMAVNVSGTGTQVGEWSSTGLNLTGAAEGLNINGVNGISYPASDSGGGSIAIGSSALAALGGSDTYGNTAIGYRSLSNMSNTFNAGSNVAIGYQTISLATSAGSNVAIGYQTISLATHSTQNTAVGFQTIYGAGVSGSAGANNTAIGFQSMYSWKSNGGANAALGSQALYTNASGAGNVALGFQALYSDTGNNNTASGSQALHNNQTGIDNAAYGTLALNANTTGNNNLGAGYGVGSSTLQSGSNDILIGTDSTTDTPTASTSNWLNIGNAIYGYNLYNGTNTTGVAQIAIGTNLTSVTAGAVLDLSSNTTTANSSLVLPVGSSAARPTTGVNGMIRYNNTLNAAEGFINGAWTSFLTAANSGSTYLGTSASTANPQINGDPTSGFYTPAASTVAVTAGGKEVEQWNTLASAVDYLSITPAIASGSPIIAAAGSTNAGIYLSPAGTGAVNITTPNTGLQLGGGNAISFPTSDTPFLGSSLAIGVGALSGQTASGVYNNVAIGPQALASALTTAATQNTAVGSYALNSNTTGARNTAVGASALILQSTG